MSVSIRKYIYCQLNNLRSHILLSQVLPCYILYALAKHNDLAFCSYMSCHEHWPLESSNIVGVIYGHRH